ncbi:hypothetical protein GCM10010402_00280 [Actinomadura luteofluorescens]|nr:hypothetical protein [Actinomadura glauciflava]
MLVSKVNSLLLEKSLLQDLNLCTRLHEAGEETVSLGRLRRLESLTVEKRDEYEGLVLLFASGDLEPLRTQTRPVFRLSWNVMPLGVW